MTVVGTDGLARPAWASVDPLLGLLRHRVGHAGPRRARPLRADLRSRASRPACPGRRSCASGPPSGPPSPTSTPTSWPTYTDADVERLLADAGIVRNRAKIRATITNARATLALRDDPRVTSRRSCGRSSRPTPRDRTPTPRCPRPRRVPRAVQGARARGSPSSGPPRCTRSWRPSASSTRTCSDRTAAAAPAGSGRPSLEPSTALAALWPGIALTPPPRRAQAPPSRTLSYAVSTPHVPTSESCSAQGH